MKDSNGGDDGEIVVYENGGGEGFVVGLAEVVLVLINDYFFVVQTGEEMSIIWHIWHHPILFIQYDNVKFQGIVG